MLRVCGKGFVQSFFPIVSYKGKIYVTKLFLFQNCSFGLFLIGFLSFISKINYTFLPCLFFVIGTFHFLTAPPPPPLWKAFLRQVPFTSEVRFWQAPFTLKLYSDRPVFVLNEDSRFRPPKLEQKIQIPTGSFLTFKKMPSIGGVWIKNGMSHFIQVTSLSGVSSAISIRELFTHASQHI